MIYILYGFGSVIGAIIVIHMLYKFLEWLTDNDMEWVLMVIIAGIIMSVLFYIALGT